MDASDRVDVRGSDERSVCVQLAARWAELYPPADGQDTRAAVSERFRLIHGFVDAVIHGIEPPPIR